jgi:eukaryotic-like serine/threonine-protein kinase
MKRAPLTGIELERSVRAQLYGEPAQVVATGAPGVRDDPRRAGLGRLLGGRYILVELLGAGGMATVYRARDERLGRDVAVKVIAAGLVQDGVAVRRFRREAELGARLVHTNIVTVLDAGVEPQDFIVMELVEGVDAGTLVRRTGRLSLHHALRIVAPICEALQYAHDEDVIHGDVSGSNILIRQRDSAPKLIDFGLASQTSDIRDGRPGRVTGTPGHIAPELLSGAAPSARSDLYSLAAVAHRLLAGPADSRPADPGTTVPAASAALPMPALAKKRPDVPRALTDAVQQALSPDPDARQASVAEFRAQLAGKRPAPLLLPNVA